ncbi:MAG: hypothetical protein AAB569_00810 [Patescibacteria group bacterium]
MSNFINKNICKLIFFTFLVFYLSVGYYFTQILKIYHNDAIARTALAFFTIFGRDPHLAAIGFVWQPFLSLVEIPLILVLRPFGLMMMAGPAITAIFGALSALLIYKIGLLVNPQGKLSSFIISLLFGINPLILLYSSIGTSEAVFLFSLIISSYFFVKWFYKMNQLDFLQASFFMSFSFWSRYESVPAIIAFILLLVIQLIFKRIKYKKIESALILFILPFSFSVGFWIVLNWFIMKNPLYFLNSEYSNSAFTTGIKNNPQAIENSYHSLVGSFLYVIKRLILLAPIIVTLPFIIFDFLVNIKKRAENFIFYLFLVLPYFFILLFHIYELFQGQSFGWLRFYIYILVIGSFTVIIVVNKQKYLTILLILLLLLGITTTGYAMSRPDIGKEEASFVRKVLNNSASLDYSRTYEDQKAVASFMDNSSGMILVDTNKGFAIPLFSKNPKRYIITSDIDYSEVVKNYPSYADWLIINKPDFDDLINNKIYKYYPNIWDNNDPSIILYNQIADWRIFKVINIPY